MPCNDTLALGLGSLGMLLAGIAVSIVGAHKLNACYGKASCDAGLSVNSLLGATYLFFGVFVLFWTLFLLSALVQRSTTSQDDADKIPHRHPV